MEIIQEKGFGEEGSAMERYFAHLEQVYERNSVQGCQCLTQSRWRSNMDEVVGTKLTK